MATPEELIEASCDELFAALGAQVAPPQALPGSLEELVDKGRHWFGKNRERLMKLICRDEVIETLNASRDDIALLIAVADLLSDALKGVAPFTVAALIVKIGLLEFCSATND